MSGDIFKLENINELDSVECTLVPGLQTKQHIKESLEEFDIQEGEFPEARAGHKMFTYENDLVVVGGYTSKEEKHRKVPANCEQNILKYETKSSKWSTFEVIGDKTLVERHDFGATSVSETEIYFCGGATYSPGFSVLSIDKLVKLTLGEKEATITIIQLDMPPQPLHSFTMSNNQGKMYIFGGLTEALKEEPNGELIVANPITSTVERIPPPEHLSQKTNVFGSSSMWLEDESLLLLGGSTPPLGYGGRSVFLYSSKKNDLGPCQLVPKCVMPADFKGDTKMIICDFCETDIHFYCDPKLRGKICFKDQYYKCPMCSKKRKRGIN